MFLSASLLAGAAFISRCIAVSGVDPHSGYGSDATRLGLLVLLGLAVVLFIVFKVYLLRHPLPITLPPTGGNLGIPAALCTGAAGIITLGGSLILLVQLVGAGAIPMLLMSREELIAIGLREFSFRWLLASSLLGIPTGIWMLLLAIWNLKKQDRFPGGLWLSLFPGLYYITRALALYVGGGGNPNDEISASVFCLVLTVLVAVCRFGTYISLDMQKKYGETLAPICPLALVAAGAALPNLPLMLSDPISAALLLADCLLAMYLFSANRSMFTTAKRDHDFTIQEVD